MVLPERLLKTRQVARALGFSVSTVKRWVDSGDLMATRTVGKHRLVSLSEVERFARLKALPLTGLRALCLFADGEEPDCGNAITDLMREAFTTALSSGETSRAREVLFQAYDAVGAAVALADELIRPAMERIGNHWKAGTLDVFQEHQASQVIVSAVTELIRRAAEEVGLRAPLALGASPEGDLYTLALLLGELSLRELGWDVRNLGANLPLRSLANAALQYRPKLIFLSVNHLNDPGRFCQEYRDFHQAAASVGSAVVLGGRALGPDLRARLVYASYGERMAHLTEFARRLVPTPGGHQSENDHRTRLHKSQGLGDDQGHGG